MALWRSLIKDSRMDYLMSTTHTGVQKPPRRPTESFYGNYVDALFRLAMADAKPVRDWDWETHISKTKAELQAEMDFPLVAIALSCDVTGMPSRASCDLDGRKLRATNRKLWDETLSIRKKLYAQVSSQLYVRARCPTPEDMRGEKGKYAWRMGTYTRAGYQRAGIATNIYRWVLEQLHGKGFLGVHVQAQHPWMQKVCLQDGLPYKTFETSKYDVEESCKESACGIRLTRPVICRQFYVELRQGAAGT
ncbi:hypothetical protein QBC42DRAFT_327123 [Cladorrhinum samala]|uniref:N-acetyltransferase domain-containing protein n=1 Tax=Cladorrhinum samala TaxID=585594 RepID=A0AAV9HND5_9PEZI|nr:hypothetical protein QBC42DRAFT_327123 [Cladorrhinum samala]